MFAVLAEDRSDADSLAVLVKRISGIENDRVFKKGFSGCGELCRKAGSHIADFASQGATHFIICHDSDGNDPAAIRQKVNSAIAGKTDLKQFKHKIVVPVQELEAWIIADETAIKKAIPTLSIPAVGQPEAVNSPKEWLVRESRRERSRPLYDPATFNHRVAMHLDIATVERKCSSFRELTEFIRGDNK
jgi:hypothetical protein